MKKFTKLFLSCAAVAALSTAIGVSAMAADITGDVKGTFDETAKTVTISNAEELGADSGTQVTFLVFKGAADTDISAESVKGIDQGTSVQPTNNGLKSDVVAPEEGQPQDTYTVKVGYYKSGTFTVKSGTFKLGQAAGEEFVLGDIDGDDFLGVDGVGTDDAAMILKYSSNQKTGVGDAGKKITLVEAVSQDGVSLAAGKTIALGDVDGDDFLGVDGVGTDDAAMVLKYSSGQKTGTGLAGVKVTGTVVTE